MSAMATQALQCVGSVRVYDVVDQSMSYPFSANLVAINAPKPDAPPVTMTDLSLKMERSSTLDRSATGAMIIYSSILLY